MKHCLWLVVGLAVAGCSNGLTYSGYRAQPVSLLTAQDCKFVGPASTATQSRNSAVQDSAIDTANARNQAATIGGNAVVFIITSSTSGASSFQKHAYQCPRIFSGTAD